VGDLARIRVQRPGVVAIQIAIALPAAEVWSENQEAYEAVLGTVLFVTIAFAGTGVDLVETILTTWLIKVAWEAAATPLTSLLADGLKRREGLDVFDVGPRAAPAGAAG
jgi:hypothetical protein